MHKMPIWIKDIIEIIFSFGLFINALLFLPQAIKLFKIKNSKELSLLTFAGFNVIQLFVVLHGYIVKDYLLVFGYTLSFITCGGVAVLIVWYRLKKT
jgi:MtN3 and saliva related transmembrane protein